MIQNKKVTPLAQKLEHLRQTLNQLKSRLTYKNKPQQSTKKNTKLSENRILPIRAAKHAPDFYYARLLQIWNILLISLALDLLIACGLIVWPLEAKSSEKILAFSACSLGIAALGLLREQIIDRLPVLKGKLWVFTNKSHKYSWLIIVITIPVVIFEVLTKLKTINYIVLLVIFIAGLQGLRASYEIIKQHNARRAALNRDKSLLLDDFDQAYFIFNALPLFAARVASFFSSIMLGTTSEHSSILIGLLIAGWLLLFSLMPQIEHFKIYCKRCSRPTSRAIKHFGYCPECKREEFQIIN